MGDEGWFAVPTIPDSWNTAGPTSDGLSNFIGNPAAEPEWDHSLHGVGPGLGTGLDPESLLDKIPDVTPLRATGLAMLVGHTLCAVVYDSDVSINYVDPINGSLKGANYGTVAFRVLSVTALDKNVDQNVSSSSLPKASIRIMDAEQVCRGPLTLFTEAPEPISSSDPFDVGS